jgi:hypothetical protein
VFERIDDEKTAARMATALVHSRPDKGRVQGIFRPRGKIAARQAGLIPDDSSSRSIFASLPGGLF